jgi:hypothetical protein
MVGTAAVAVEPAIGLAKGDAIVQAKEALGLALLTYPARGKPLPEASAIGADLIPGRA